MKKSLLLLLLALFALPALGQSDLDGDGVDDAIDLCPDESGARFDSDGDGCPDSFRNTRHIEYWDLDDLPFTYVVHADGAQNIGDGSDIAAIQAAFAAWSQPDNLLAASFGGTVPNADTNGMNGIHEVSFVDPDYLQLYGSAVIAVGLTTSFEAPTNFLGKDVRPGQIVDADMLFNPIRLFRTDTAGSSIDLLSVATHEAGHIFGLSHSAIPLTTLFPAVPPGTGGRTLELDDRVAAFMAAPEPAALADASVLSGRLLNGLDNAPIGGAIIFLLDAASGDQVACSYSFADGSWQFLGVPDGEYFVYVHPLDGSPGANNVTPPIINELVESLAGALFVPEYWDQAESAQDDSAARTAIAVAAGTPVVDLLILSNVDASGPELVEVKPASGASSVLSNTVVLVAFDEALDFDTATQAFRLQQTSTGTGVSGTLTLLSEGKVLVFSPRTRLAAQSQYELILGTSLSDRFGNPIADEIRSSFTTAPPPPLAIDSASPTQIVSGTTIVIAGQGFDPGNAPAHQVFFGGIATTASVASATHLVVAVPDLFGSEGPIEVAVTLGAQESNPIVLNVVSQLEIARGTPAGESALAGTPRRLAMLPDANFGYVAHDSGLASVVLANSQNDYGSVREIPFAAGCVDVAVHPDGRRVYAISGTGQRLLVVNSDYVDLDARDPQFNTLLDEQPVLGTPRAIAIDPDGTRAFLAMSDGKVQVWDIQIGSETFHRQIGEFTSSATTLAACAAFDRSGSRLLLADSSGRLLIHDADSYEQLFATAIAGDPRDLSGDPTGQLVYVTHGGGDVSVVSAISGNRLATVPAPGALRGIGVSPAGLLGYVANRSGDALDVIDLNPNSPSFRLVGSNFALPGDPVDVVVSPDGLYAYALEEQSRSLRVFGIGFGPTLEGISPRVARPGDVVRLWGDGMAAFDIEHDVISSSSTRVYFNGQPVFPVHSTGQATYAAIPQGFTGGTVQVSFEGAAFPNLPVETLSNPQQLRVLPTQPMAVVGGLLLDADGGFPSGGGAGLPVGAISDDSSIGAYATDTELVIFDADRSSPTFLQQLASYDYSGETVNSDEAWQLIISPRNNAIFLSYYFAEPITVIDGDRNSPSFGQKVSNVDFSSVGNCYAAGPMAITPDGQTLVIADVCNDRMLLANPIPEDIQDYFDYEVTLVGAGIGYCVDLLVHPNGNWAYGMVGGQLYSVDINPLSPSYGIATDNPVIGDANSLDISADGSLIYVLTHTGFGSDLLVIVHETLTDPELPQEAFRVTIESPTGGDPGRLRLAPDGRFAMIDVGNSNLFAYDFQEQELLFVLPHQGNETIPAGMSWWPDGSALLLVPSGDDPIVFGRQAGFKDRPIAGTSQTGVAGQPLPAPVQLQIHDGTGIPVRDTLVELKVTGGGGLFGNGRAYQVVMADNSGRIRFEWTLGPDPDTNPALPTNHVQVSFRNGSSVGGVFAYSVADPNATPISMASLLPAEQSVGVAVSTVVQAVFSRAVDRATIGPASFALRDLATSAPIAGSFGFAEGDRRVSFVPAAPLAYSGNYEIALSATIRDLSGNALLNPTTHPFSTQAPPPLAISAISPPAATAGTEVVISGVGFAAIADENVVSFGGTLANATAATPTSVRVRVPLGALSGAVRVDALAQQSNALNFTVLIPSTSAIDEVLGIVDTGATIRNIAISPDGRIAYSVASEADQVLPVELSTLASLPPIPVGDNPVAIVIHPQGTRAYVANFGGSSVSVIDLTTNFVVATIPVGDSPVDLVLAPAGDRLYVVNSVEQTLSVIDTDAANATYHTVVATVPTGATTKGAAISPDGTKLYLGTSNGFLVVSLDTASFGIVAAVPTGATTKGAAITPDGSLLLLVTANGDVLLVDITPEGGNAIVATVPTGATTKGAAISPDGGLLYIIPEVGDEILVIELVYQGSVSKADGVVGPTIILNPLGVTQAGKDPELLIFDPTGSGLAIAASGADGKLTVLSDEPLGIEVEIDVDPRPGDKPHLGRWIEVCVSFPPGRDPKDVDLDSVLMNGVIPTEVTRASYPDCNGDGVDDLLLLFDRELFQDVIPSGPAVEIRVTGSFVSDGQTWFGEDVIQTQRPELLSPGCGDVYSPGDKILVTWNSPDDVETYIVHIYYSIDDGETWTIGVAGTADEGAAIWEIPYVVTNALRILIVGLDKDLNIYGQTMLNCRNEVAEGVVPVAMSPVSSAVEGGAGVLRWSASGGPSTLGFHVWRGERAQGPFVQLTERPLGGQAKDGSLAFEFADASIEANRSYWYRLQESASSIQHGPYEMRWRLLSSLSPNQPNPFNPRTTIRFALAESGHAKLVVYDLRGRLVRVLLDTELRAREYTVVWDGKDAGGDEVASGIYLYRLSAPGYSESRKMTLVR